jgi:hypothetical protein
MSEKLSAHTPKQTFDPVTLVARSPSQAAINRPAQQEAWGGPGGGGAENSISDRVRSLNGQCDFTHVLPKPDRSIAAIKFGPSIRYTLITTTGATRRKYPTFILFAVTYWYQNGFSCSLLTFTIHSRRVPWGGDQRHSSASACLLPYA